MTNQYKIEDQHLEFKKQLTDKFEKEVVAFLNAKDGGVIIQQFSVKIIFKLYKGCERYQKILFALNFSFLQIIFNKCKKN
ncbi:helix-turn-helix domain-containing protein [Psychromonas antarctica]|uniref:AlbA family DNA-binding domain-containing protein n=1 Tax=Psychromonas antarctica TaxID=67573 RepID=UPI001EE91D8B|nr:ATP-binding protein [Psychromonas antarctica]MCG6202769.1 ATP-binding protein [Psychromonas antarctica]